jgi:hypothetical protein
VMEEQKNDGRELIRNGQGRRMQVLVFFFG